jgi:tetratricopeptide (TPR) repeat protein
VWLERAGILFEDKKIEDARAAYLKAIQATKPAVVTKGGLHAHVRAAAAYQLALMDLSTNNYVEAESYARMALSTGEDGVGYHATLSRCLVGQGRMDEAKAENQIELDLRMNSRRSTAVRP